MASRLESPSPPYSVGVLIPKNPNSPIFFNISFGTGFADSSISSAKAVNSF